MTIKKALLSLAALLIASAMFVACSGSEEFSSEQQQPAEQTDEAKTYTMTIEASRVGDEASTRLLKLDGTKLLASWTWDDQVKVYKPVAGANVYDPDTYVEVGTLKTNKPGTTTMFTGTVTLSQKTNLFFFNAGQGGVSTVNYDYSNQGVAALNILDLGNTYDRAMAMLYSNQYTLSGNSVFFNNGVSLTFENQQAVVRFKLQDASGTAVKVNDFMVEATDGYSFRMKGDGTTATPTPGSTITAQASYAEGSSEFYIAIPPMSGSGSTFPIRLTATGTDGYNYYYEKADVPVFEKGKYYVVTVKMNRYRDLSKLDWVTKTYTAVDGDELRGALPSGKYLHIADGASVTLNGVTIAVSPIIVGESETRKPGITCDGNATITLVGENSVTSSCLNCAGIQAGGTGTTLTIKGDGKLTAEGGPYGAGIGAYNLNCGNIIINGGTITARGGESSAGIGGGNGSVCGDIKITGGNITATGRVNSQGQKCGAGIGSGYNGTCGAITISGGEVNATAGNNYGAGIGSGVDGKFASITITDGISGVTAYGVESGAGYHPIGRGSLDKGSGPVTVDGVENWTGAETPHLNFSAGGDHNQYYMIWKLWRK